MVCVWLEEREGFGGLLFFIKALVRFLKSFLHLCLIFLKNTLKSIMRPNSSPIKLAKMLENLG